MSKYYYCEYNFDDKFSIRGKDNIYLKHCQILYQADETVNFIYGLYIKTNFNFDTHDKKWYKLNNEEKDNENGTIESYKSQMGDDKWKEYDTMEEVLIDFPELMLI